MLGSIDNGSSFQWAIAGKHPAAADYIRLGAQSAVLDAVADWVAKGYDALQRDGHRLQSGCSWRFWLRGAKKQALICGLCRDSSDRIGRPFPFLVMGEGLFKSLEKTWARLPLQLDKIWRTMEYIAVHRFDDLQTMIAELTGLSLAAANDPLTGIDPGNGAVADRLMAQCREGLQTCGWGLISLADIQAQDPAGAAAFCHARLQACSGDMPRAVFLGGPVQHPYMLVLQQPLNTSDFVRLWTV